MLKCKGDKMNAEEVIKKHLEDIRNFKNEFITTNQSLIPEYINLANPYFNTILVYLCNLAELSNQFAVLQEKDMNMSSIIVSRSIFEECAILNQLFKQSKYGVNSYFYKYLYIMDMSQDITINKGWNNEAMDYWRRIHYFLQTKFKYEVDLKEIQPFSENIEEFKGYTKPEKEKLKKIVADLKEKHCYNFTKAKICSDLFNDVYLNTELAKLDTESAAKCDIRVIYGQLCHYSHLNLTAIDEINTLKNEDGTSKFCFNQEINNNNVILQWMKYSLEYILMLFNGYCENNK